MLLGTAGLEKVLLESNPKFVPKNALRAHRNPRVHHPPSGFSEEGWCTGNLILDHFFNYPTLFFQVTNHFIAKGVRRYYISVEHLQEFENGKTVADGKFQNTRW